MKTAVTVQWSWAVQIVRPGWLRSTFVPQIIIDVTIVGDKDTMTRSDWVESEVCTMLSPWLLKHESGLYNNDFVRRQDK